MLSFGPELLFVFGTTTVEGQHQRNNEEERVVYVCVCVVVSFSAMSWYDGERESCRSFVSRLGILDAGTTSGAQERAEHEWSL
jgi:hypothetical protein